MLVLKRNKDETVVITCPDGTEVRVMVADVQGRSVRLGFTAPAGVKIDRLEIYEAKKASYRSKEITSAEAEPKQDQNGLVCTRCWREDCTCPPSYNPRAGAGPR